jgi:hypothetical protein
VAVVGELAGPGAAAGHDVAVLAGELARGTVHWPLATVPRAVGGRDQLVARQGCRRDGKGLE